MNDECPGLKDLGLIFAEFLVTLAVHLESVLICESGCGVNGYHALVFANGEVFRANKLEHPVLPLDFLSKRQKAQDKSLTTPRYNAGQKSTTYFSIDSNDSSATRGPVLKLDTVSAISKRDVPRGYCVIHNLHSMSKLLKLTNGIC